MSEWNVQDSTSGVRKYGAFQNVPSTKALRETNKLIVRKEVYVQGMLHGVRPTITYDPNKLEKRAKEVMSAESYSYVAGGAGERATMDANRLAFRQWKLVPRMLRATTSRDMSVTLFGETYDSPILVAPVGVQSVFHRDGEVGVAEEVHKIGVPYITSTASSFSMEEIAKANGPGPRWYQLYWPFTESITESLLKRGHEAGYKVLVVTLDTWALAWRPWDLDLAFIPFVKGIGNQTGFADPVFQEHFRNISGGKEIKDNVLEASQAWIQDVFSGKAHSWDQLAHVRKHWSGPIVLKGIQHPDDAVKAWECGMDGIVVSNHGGRQLDGAVGSLEQLPEIVEAVRGKKSPSGHDFTVLFDSGVRTGVDVIKAMCLGAKATLIGRPWVYGLGINGKAGARDALKGLLADIDQSMGIAGISSLRECSKENLKKVQYGGDRASNN